MIHWQHHQPAAGFEPAAKVGMHQTYNDHANEQSLLPSGLGDRFLLHFKCGRSGSELPFPVKLHYMLEHVEQLGFTSIVSWQCHGRCFVVHKQEEFVDLVMKQCFRQTKFPSFQRQLNLYGFRRITSGKDKGGYYHELFLRNKRFLSYQINRLKIKGTKVRQASSPGTEPDFYAMPFLPPQSFAGNSSSANSTTPNLMMKAIMDPLSPPSQGLTPQLAVDSRNYGGKAHQAPHCANSLLEPTSAHQSKVPSANAVERPVQKKTSHSEPSRPGPDLFSLPPTPMTQPTLFKPRTKGEKVQPPSDKTSVTVPFNSAPQSGKGETTLSGMDQTKKLISDQPILHSWFQPEQQNLYINEDFDFDDIFDSLMQVPPPAGPKLSGGISRSA